MIHLIPICTTFNSLLAHAFSILPFSKDNLKIINNFNFQFSDLTDTEYVTLCNLLIKHKNCYASHINNVGKFATPFRIRLKSNAQRLLLNTQRLSKHYSAQASFLLLFVESGTRKFRCLSVECLFVESGTNDVICQFCTVKGMVVESEILKALCCALSK